MGRYCKRILCVCLPLLHRAKIAFAPTISRTSRICCTRVLQYQKIWTVCAAHASMLLYRGGLGCHKIPVSKNIATPFFFKEIGLTRIDDVKENLRELVKRHKELSGTWANCLGTFTCMQRRSGKRGLEYKKNLSSQFHCSLLALLLRHNLLKAYTGIRISVGAQDIGAL